MGLRDRIGRTQEGNGGRPATTAPLTFERQASDAAPRQNTAYQQIKNVCVSFGA